MSHQFWLIFRNTTKARETCTAVTWSSVLQALCSATLQRCVAKKFSKSSMYMKSCISVLYWYLSKCRWQTWFWITWSCTAEDRGRLYKARPADSFQACLSLASRLTQQPEVQHDTLRLQPWQRPIKTAFTYAEEMTEFWTNRNSFKNLLFILLDSLFLQPKDTRAKMRECCKCLAWKWKVPIFLSKCRVFATTIQLASRLRSCRCQHTKRASGTDMGPNIGHNIICLRLPLRIF